MPYFDLTEEGILNAEVSSAFQQILDANTWYKWWTPYIEAKIQGGEELIQPNSIVEIKIHYTITAKFLAKFKDIEENKSIDVEYFKGDFVGTGEWFFEPLDGKTKVLYHFHAKPNTLLIRLLLKFIDFRKAHSKIMQAGFQGLNDYLR